MSRHELKRFRIDCDWQYACSINSVLIEDVADRFEADEKAAELGWHTALSHGCPQCVDNYARRVKV